MVMRIEANDINGKGHRVSWAHKLRPPLKGHHCPRCARSCESMSEWRGGVSLFAPAPCTWSIPALPCSASTFTYGGYPGSGGRPLLGLDLPCRPPD